MKTELSLFSTFTVIQLYKLCVVSNTKIIWVEFRFYSPTICQVLEKRNMEHDLSAFISLFLQISQYIISKYNNISAPDSWTRPGNSSIHGNWNFVLLVSYSFFFPSRYVSSHLSNHFCPKRKCHISLDPLRIDSSVMGKRGNVEINNSPQAGIEPGPLDFKSSTLPNELQGYLFSSFGRVLDLKSGGPRFNSRLGWIGYSYISSLFRYIWCHDLPLELTGRYTCQGRTWVESSGWRFLRGEECNGWGLPALLLALR